MLYVIMCGQNHTEGWCKPRQQAHVNGECLVKRTIRLLEECEVMPGHIWITTDEPHKFADVNCNVLKYDSSGLWVNCFHKPENNASVCYLFGDVYYSYSAIWKIVSHETTDIDFFASTDKHCLTSRFLKKWAEPFAFKVKNVERFFSCVEESKKLFREGRLHRLISWELWQVIKGTELNKIDYTNYIPIDDYTCDLDDPKDIGSIESCLEYAHVMIHAVPERLWYVRGYLIPELERQGMSNITVWCDYAHMGNLWACWASFNCLDNVGFTWHLQDDVVPSKDLTILKYADQLSPTAVFCGFASTYDDETPGVTNPKGMWLSFPCIGIPNHIAKGFPVWCKNLAINDNQFRDQISAGKYDDSLFKSYMQKVHTDCVCHNVEPNIVNHIDWLIGGTMCNSVRKDQHVESVYFNEPDTMKRLEEWLDDNKRK